MVVWLCKYSFSILYFQFEYDIILVTKEVTKGMNVLTESEEVIMKLLWENEFLSIMQLVKILDEQKHWTKHAIISFLKRMEEKELVSYKIEGRTKYYFAKVNRDALIIKETSSVLNRFFSGKWGAMMSYMIRNNDFSTEDIQELYDLIQELKKEKDT